jgi:hypothetical protein
VAAKHQSTRKIENRKNSNCPAAIRPTEHREHKTGAKEEVSCSLPRVPVLYRERIAVQQLLGAGPQAYGLQNKKIA